MLFRSYRVRVVRTKSSGQDGNLYCWIEFKVIERLSDEGAKKGLFGQCFKVQGGSQKAIRAARAELAGTMLAMLPAIYDDVAEVFGKSVAKKIAVGKDAQIPEDVYDWIFDDDPDEAENPFEGATFLLGTRPRPMARAKGRKVEDLDDDDIFTRHVWALDEDDED